MDLIRTGIREPLLQRWWDVRACHPAQQLAHHLFHGAIALLDHFSEKPTLLLVALLHADTPSTHFGFAGTFPGNLAVCQNNMEDVGGRRWHPLNLSGHFQHIRALV